MFVIVVLCAHTRRHTEGETDGYTYENTLTQREIGRDTHMQSFFHI